MKTIICIFAVLFTLAIAARHFPQAEQPQSKKAAPAIVSVANAPQLSAAQPVIDERLYRQFHEYYAARFGQQKGFGPSRIIPTASVHTILSHGTQEERGSFRITKMELMGLTAGPVVHTNGSYLATPDGKLNATHVGLSAPKSGSSKSPTRSLSAFEQRALQEMKLNRTEVVVEENGRTALVVGALHADANCAKCHEVEKGALLGALVYSVERVTRN